MARNLGRIARPRIIIKLLGSIWKERESIFAMEIEIVSICKLHWNVLPMEIAIIYASYVFCIMCNICVDFANDAIYVRLRYMIDHWKTRISSNNIYSIIRLKLKNRFFIGNDILNISYKTIFIYSIYKFVKYMKFYFYLFRRKSYHHLI